MAQMRATKKKKPGSDPSKRPAWLMDFCDHLKFTYGCARKDFQGPFASSPDPSIPECDGLIYWLNLFEIAPGTGPAPKAPGDPFVAVLPTGSKKGIEVHNDKISSVSKKASAEEIMEMVVLAKANPALNAAPIFIDGSEEEKKMLTIACSLAGLAVDNPETITPKDKKLVTRVQTSYQKFYGEMVTESKKLHAAKASRVMSDVIENTPDAAVKALLKKVDEKAYKQAKKDVIAGGKVSGPKLKAIFGAHGTTITNSQATDILGFC